MRKGKKVMIFGFPDHHRGLKSPWTKVTLHMGKKGFFGGFYPFPSKSESYTKFEKNW